jgi:hypothetical protein
MSTAEQRYDHDRDIRKHDWRPGDPPSLSPDPIPFRLQPVMPAALEIAVLVKGISNYTDAAKLIEQYAQTVASEARLEAVAETSDRIMALINGPSHA